jgi:ketosteroid isomerase-like protein
MRSAASIAIAVAALAACQRADTPEQVAARHRAETDSARAYFEQVAAAYARHLAAGNVDSLVAFYAESATVMQPNMAEAKGHAAIREMFTQMFAAMGNPTMTFRQQNVVANGGLAVERGRYTMTAPMADSGKYLVHWHRLGGRWLIVSDISNSDLPPPPPAPARRRG